MTLRCLISNGEMDYQETPFPASFLARNSYDLFSCESRTTVGQCNNTTGESEMSYVVVLILVGCDPFCIPRICLK